MNTELDGVLVLICDEPLELAASGEQVSRERWAMHNVNSACARG